MPIQCIIKERRKALGLTQEQIASALGVSTPAVSKWESGGSYPDMSLMPVLARLLKVDLNTLFCFNQEMTGAEMEDFCLKVRQRIQKEGFDAGEMMVMEKLREYPNNDELLHRLTLLLEGALVSFDREQDYGSRYEDRLVALYEKAIHTADSPERNISVFMLASKYISRGEDEKAQALLDMLPEHDGLDKVQLQVNLCVKQGKLKEGEKLLERKLMAEVTGVYTRLLGMVDIAIKEEDYERATALAEISRKTVELFELWSLSAFSAPLEVSATQKDVASSIPLVDAMLSVAKMPWEPAKTLLYGRFMSDIKRDSEKIESHLLSTMILDFENNPKFAFLKSNPEFQEILRRYRIDGQDEPQP